MRKKAWGTDHMMRSGKRSVDDWYPGVLVVPDNLDRESRSGITRNSWGGVHMLRTGKRSGQRQNWGQYFLRSLRNRAGPYIRGGKGTNFGGGHMMRTGK